MITITYSSHATDQLAVAQRGIEHLLEVSRARNLQRGITGLLLFRDGIFIQVLEGETADVQFIYRLICQDPRHRSIVKLLEERISSRRFPSWSMGYRALSDRDLRYLDPTPDSGAKPVLDPLRLLAAPEQVATLIRNFAPKGSST
jgi:hypothetical protein